LSASSPHTGQALLKHCDEFIDPISPAITETKIRAKISAAQRAFGIIAPEYWRRKCGYEWRV